MTEPRSLEDGPDRDEKIAKEINWGVSVASILFALAIVPLLGYISFNVSGPTAELASVGAQGIIVFAMLVYIIHLFSHNSLVHRGLETMLEWFSA